MSTNILQKHYKLFMFFFFYKAVKKYSHFLHIMISMGHDALSLEVCIDHNMKLCTLNIIFIIMSTINMIQYAFNIIQNYILHKYNPLRTLMNLVIGFQSGVAVGQNLYKSVLLLFRNDMRT